MRLALRSAFIASVIAFAGVASMLVPLDGSVTNVRIAGAADPIEIDLRSENGNASISFGTDCNTEMAPGDVCTDIVEVENDGDLQFQYTIALWVDSNGIDEGAGGPDGDAKVACFNVNMHKNAADGLNIGSTTAIGPLNGGSLDPGQNDDWGLEIAVVDDNACMGQTAFIIGYVFATADDTPTPTPAPPTEIPQQIVTPVPTATPVSQVGGTVSTPQATATRIAQQAGVVVTNLPSTGQGKDGQGADLWLIGLGGLLAALAASLLAANVWAEARTRR